MTGEITIREKYEALSNFATVDEKTGVVTDRSADRHFEEYRHGEEYKHGDLLHQYLIGSGMVDLVRSQLRRARERYGKSVNLVFEKEANLPVESAIIVANQQEVETKAKTASKNDLLKGMVKTKQFISWRIQRIHLRQFFLMNDENKKSDTPVIPDDFLCPISLELMRDPVIVSTGQTYERSYIQRWINCGNTTCPKTQQKLRNVTLTPNYVLRSLIAQWCINHHIEQPTLLVNRKLKRSDGSFRDVSEDIDAIELLVRNLSYPSIEKRRSALTEIRSLSKKSTDNRIMLAEVGAIPILASLLTSEDNITQENAVTLILNLSIYENKGLIKLANVVPSVVQLVLNLNLVQVQLVM